MTLPTVQLQATIDAGKRATARPYDVRAKRTDNLDGRQLIANIGQMHVTASSNCEMASAGEDSAYLAAAANIADDACEELLAARARIARLEAALRTIPREYEQTVDSGDCGHTVAAADLPEVKAARAELEATDE